MSFWDWKTGYRFQSLDTTAQPGSLDAEAGIMSSTFDRSGMRLIVGEADKTSMLHVKPPKPAITDQSFLVKIWKEDEKASAETHPVQWKPNLGQRKF